MRTTFRVTICTPGGQPQVLHGMPRAFADAVRDWWWHDIEGQTTVEIVDEDEPEVEDAEDLLERLARRH